MDSAEIVPQDTAPARTLLADVHPVLIECQYPPADLLELPIPSYRLPFTSTPSLQSATLLFSFPREGLRLIFIHGASTLVPKPGASYLDTVVLDHYSKGFLCNASLVTSSWCVEAQLEMVYCTLCQSPEALHSLVTMLEKTGRIKHLKRLSLTSEVNLEDFKMYFPPRKTTAAIETPSNSSKLTIHLIGRLIKLGPVLEELEIIGGGDDDFISCIPLLEDLQPGSFPSPNYGRALIMTDKLFLTGRTTEVRTRAVHKISERGNLYTLHTAMECSTLVLNRMRLCLNRTELDTLGRISQITSLVVMNSTFYDSATFYRPRFGDPGFTPPPFLVLTTLSLDSSELSMHLLRSNHFPAVTTFELIPGPTMDPESKHSRLIVSSLLKFPSLTKNILPLDSWLLFVKLLYAGFAEGQIEIEQAIENQWNWLDLQGGEGGETDDEESSDEEEEDSAAPYADHDEGLY